jgi:hypothetical protein
MIGVLLCGGPPPATTAARGYSMIWGDVDRDRRLRALLVAFAVIVAVVASLRRGVRAELTDLCGIVRSSISSAASRNAFASDAERRVIVEREEHRFRLRVAARDDAEVAVVR